MATGENNEAELSASWEGVPVYPLPWCCQNLVGVLPRKELPSQT